MSPFIGIDLRFLEARLQLLTERERFAVIAHAMGHTQAEIAVYFSLSRERTRQILNSGHRKMQVRELGTARPPLAYQAPVPPAAAEVLLPTPAPEFTPVWGTFSVQEYFTVALWHPILRKMISVSYPFPQLTVRSVIVGYKLK